MDRMQTMDKISELNLQEWRGLGDKFGLGEKEIWDGVMQAR